MNAELPRKGELTQARILDAAYALFMEQGYHGTSMRQIAERAGLTMGGVYNHFAGKEEIWVAVLFERHPYRVIVPALLSAEGNSAAAYIRNAAQQMIGELSRHRDLLHIMFIELIEFNGVHIPMLYERVLPEVSPLLAVIQARSSELRDISLPLLARSFLGFFFSYYISDALMPSQLRTMMDEDALDTFIDIYLHGILSASAAESDRGAQTQPLDS